MNPILKAEYVEIVTGLVKKTKEGKIPWKKDQAGMGGGAIEAFSFYSPEEKFSLFLNYVSPSAEPDYIELTIMGPKRESAGTWKVWEGDENWELALELYSEAYRFVHGSDKVFEEVKKFIASK